MVEYQGEERRKAVPSNEVLTERFDALSTKVDEFREEVREDIGMLTTAIGNLTFVDQRVHDIEIAAMKERIDMVERAADHRANMLEAEVESEKERRATNFRLAIGAMVTAFLLPALVGLMVYELTKA